MAKRQTNFRSAAVATGNLIDNSAYDTVKVVSDNIGNVSTVSSSVTNVNTVATNIVSVNTTAGDIVNINAVAGNKTNIDAVANDKTNIDAVGVDVLKGVGTNTSADSAILNALINATEAKASKDAAKISETNAATSESNIASSAAQIATNKTDISNHVGNTSNPHSVTKTQIGLGSVDNTSDVNKPVSTAQQTALNAKLNTAGGTVSGALTVSGDLHVTGTTTTVNSTTVQVADNLMVINYGETGAGVAKGYGGIQVDRGTLVNYNFMFDETDDKFKIGKVGSMVAVAAIESVPTNGELTYWDSITSTLKTGTFASTINGLVSGSTKAGNAQLLDGEDGITALAVYNTAKGNI